MCFTQRPPATPTPGAAPAPAAPPAEQQKIGRRRTRENIRRFGDANGPDTRRDSGSGLNTGPTGSSINL
jgi:hypothetical protein